MDTSEPELARESPGNGATLVVVLLLAAWIVGLTVIAIPAVWFAEQFTLTTGGTFSRWTWIVVNTSLAIAVLLPSLIGIAIVKTPGLRAVFRTLSLVGLFMLLLLPVQLVEASDAQAAALIQIAASLGYLALLWLIERRGGTQGDTQSVIGSGAISPALLAATLLAFPWVIWGALGSWLDTLLNLTAALLLGSAAARTLSHSLLPAMKGDDKPRIPFFVGGLVCGVALLAMGASFGHNGQQLILLFLLPALGWLVAAIGCWGGPGNPAINRRSVALLIGLAAAAPMIFIDPEELALILNLGSRDIAYYVFFATLIGIGAGLILGIVARIFYQRNVGGSILTPIIGAAALVGLALSYWLLGQPGLYGEQLYVILHDQADLPATAGIADPVERREYVYHTLVQHAALSQDGLRRAFESTRISYKPYYLVNALEVDAGPFVRMWLEARPEVDRVLISPELRPLPEMPPTSEGTAAAPGQPQWNLVDIGAQQVWESLNVRGTGIVIGQSDSGVDGAHIELREQYRGNRADGPPGDSYNWFDPWNETPSPSDWGGHGTHTLGSVLGRSVGVAPDATWIGCVNLARNLGNAPRYLDCLQFHLAPFPQAGDPFADGRPELGANVLNNSWGCPEIEGCDPTSLLPAVRALRAAGVFVVASAGNDGAACSTINDPISLYDDVFTVGATDVWGSVTPFSSRGPVTADGSGRTKPDVVAPGEDILSAYPNGTYEFASGTSMAGPHVAGVVALLWSANPALIGDIDRTEQILIETAHPISDAQPGVVSCGDDGLPPNNVSGYGIVNAYDAVTRALSIDE